jgi:methionine synthase I (cobalamin-dependent)
MSQFADIFASRPVLADGAMGTVLYARGVFINRCYDELNLSDPSLILSIHEEPARRFLKATPLAPTASVWVATVWPIK